MFIVAIAVMSLIVMWLWNLLIPDLFHGPEVSYLQAAGLLVLTRLLVGMRGRRHRWWAPWSKRNWKRHWRNEWYGYGPYYARKHRHSHQRWSEIPQTEGQSQEEWQAVKNKWKAEFGNRMHDWWKEWEAMSPEERRQYKEERRRAHRDWKEEYRNRRSAWKQEYRADFGRAEGDSDRRTSSEEPPRE